MSSPLTKILKENGIFVVEKMIAAIFAEFTLML